MHNDLTLHCFPGDLNSLSLLLLAEYLNIDLKTRYLKPVNITEKFYKVSLTKKFPMLEVKTTDGYYLIERSNCIMRFLTEAVKSDVSDKSKFSYAIGNQNLDYINQELMPALLTLRALRMAIIEEDPQLDEQLVAELHQKLTDLDTVIAKQTDTSVNHSDFLLFVMLRGAYDIPCLHPKLKSLSACQHRWQQLASNEKFKTVCSPYTPVHHN